MDEKAVIDRVEDGDQAVLLVGEDERERIVPVSSLPEKAQAGSWLKVRFEGDELVAVALDLDEAERVKERITDKMARLRQRGRRKRT